MIKLKSLKPTLTRKDNFFHLKLLIYTKKQKFNIIANPTRSYPECHVLFEWTLFPVNERALQQRVNNEVVLK